MQDSIDTRQAHARHGALVGNVGSHHLNCFHVIRCDRRWMLEHRDLEAPVLKMLDKTTPDESESSGYENFLHTCCPVPQNAFTASRKGPIVSIGPSVMVT